MNPEFLKRKEKQDGLVECLKPFSFCKGILSIGSMAHSEDNIDKDSDIGISMVLDFDHADINALYKKGLHQHHDSVAEQAVQKGKANIIIVRWKKDEIKFGVNIYDQKALNQIVSLTHKPLKIICEPDFDGNSQLEKLISLRGKELGFSPNIYEDYDKGRTLQKVFPFYDYKDELYLGAVINSLLMSPKILFERQNYLDIQLKHLRKNFSEAIQRKYSVKRMQLSYMNALPERIRNKVPAIIREELDRLVQGHF